MILFKADRLDGEGSVEGYFKPLFTYLGEKQKYGIDTATTYDINDNSLNVFEVNPQTLEISFDGGKSWYSIEEAKRLVAIGQIVDVSNGKE